MTPADGSSSLSSRKRLLIVRASILLILAILSGLAEPAAGGAQGEPTDPALPGEQVDVYFSPGSNDGNASLPPLQSQANIESLFEVAQKVFGANRVFWRGIQDEHYVRGQLFRPENFVNFEYWEWLRHLALDLKLNGVAVRAAHRRGMAIWGFTGLFEWGSKPKEAAYSAVKDGPAVSEDRLRVKHVEWVPTDRYGIRRQSGPFEFAYPEARQALIKALLREVLRYDYDGLMFYTYVEVTDLWFEDEFGFNEPVVREFQRRHGTDIRKEPFDREKWRRLRGEYVTTFLTELSAALHKHSKRLGVVLNASDPNLPQGWPAVDRHVPAAGRIYLDWVRWLKDKAVDEIMVDDNAGQAQFLPQALAAAKGYGVTVSALHSSAFLAEPKSLPRESMHRVLSGKLPDWEWGCKQAQMSAAAGSRDPFARMRLLRQVEEGKTILPLPEILAGLKDENTLVRRQTLRALAKTVTPDSVSAIEAALKDPDHAVRCTAVICLRTHDSDQSAQKILEAVRAHGNYQFNGEAASTLAQLAERGHLGDLLKFAKDSNPAVRRVALAAMRGKPLGTEACATILQGLNDEDVYVRWSAVMALSAYDREPGVVEALIGALHDRHPTVRVAAAYSLGCLGRTPAAPLEPWRGQVLAALKQRFGSFGASYTGPDADWAFKSTGAALRAIGPAGEEALERFLDQRVDARLADFAWRSLYLPQDEGGNYHLTTPEEAEKAYRLHPRVRSNGEK